MMNPYNPEEIGEHLIRHGDGVKDVGFLVEDVDAIFEVKMNYSHSGLDKKKNQRKDVNIFLPISFNIYFGCSKEPSR